MKKHPGLTLVEVIVSLALFGIIMMAFISLFSSGFLNTQSMGRRNEQSADASQMIEGLYAMNRENLDQAAIELYLIGEHQGEKANSEGDLGVPPSTVDGFLFYVEEDHEKTVSLTIGGSTTDEVVTGLLLVLEDYYDNNQRSVRLTAFFPTGTE